jgi:hypothetical protein
MEKKFAENLVDYAYYGIEENIGAQETVEVNLRDLMKVHATLAEFVQFFHQPMHYQSLEDIHEYLGSVHDDKGFKLLHSATYEIMNRMLPEKIQDLFDDSCFDNPQSPFYFEAKD